MSDMIATCVVRATGVLALMSIFVVHLAQLVPTLRSAPALGAGFVVLMAGALGLAMRLFRTDLSPRQMWVPVAALGIIAMAGYVLTRVLNTPLDTHDVGNWACMFGIAALFIEAWLLALSAFALAAARPVHRRPIPVRVEPLGGGDDRMPNSVLVDHV